MVWKLERVYLVMTFNIYKYSFSPDNIRDWNALPASIISSAESSEDPVARFTSRKI